MASRASSLKSALFGISLLPAMPAVGGSAGEPQADPGPPAAAGDTRKATFAGGCFWCVEADFDKMPGVIATTSGYIGGRTENPTYKEVSAGGTGHAEAVEIVYDPARVTYEMLLDVFRHSIDPTTVDRQFCDTGDQYRSAIFYHDGQQKRAAEQSKADLESSKPFAEPIVTDILAATRFYAAEEYHQDFYKKNPLRYQYYRYRCGRDQRVAERWGDAARL